MKFLKLLVFCYLYLSVLPSTGQIDSILKAVNIAPEIDKPALYNRLAKIYEDSLKPDAAYQYYKIASKSAIKNLEELQALFEKEKKEQEIVFQKQNTKIHILETVRQRNFLNLTFICIISIFLIVILLYNRYKLKRTNYNFLHGKNDAIQKTMKKLEQAEEELTRLNQSKDKFYAILTHDLKNPFNAILLTTTQLIKKFPTLNNQEIEEYAQYIHDSAQSLYQLLENLLNWAQTQRGNLKFNPVMTDIYEVIYAILPGSVADAKNKNIQIISEIHENTIAFFDIEMISATIRNLINNAIKFSYTGSIIKIKAEKDKSNLIVSIIDSGIGISADKIPSIFSGDSYFTTTGTADETGSGLGLMICTEFIEKHGGKIWVESVPTKGSTFRFIIPLYDEFKH